MPRRKGTKRFKSIPVMGGGVPATAGAPKPKTRLEEVIENLVDVTLSTREDYERNVASLNHAREVLDSTLVKMSAEAPLVVNELAPKRGAKTPKPPKSGRGGHKGSSSPSAAHKWPSSDWSGSWPCCGSKSRRRHKNACPKGGKNADGKLPPERDPIEDDEDEDEAPAVKTGRAKAYRCLSDHNFLSTDSLDELKKRGCPHCGEKTIMEKP